MNRHANRTNRGALTTVLCLLLLITMFGCGAGRGVQVAEPVLPNPQVYELPSELDMDAIFDSMTNVHSPMRSLFESIVHYHYGDFDAALEQADPARLVRGGTDAQIHAESIRALILLRAGRISAFRHVVEGIRDYYDEIDTPVSSHHVIALFDLCDISAGEMHAEELLPELHADTTPNEPYFDYRQEWVQSAIQAVEAYLSGETADSETALDCLLRANRVLARLKGPRPLLIDLIDQRDPRIAPFDLIQRIFYVRAVDLSPSGILSGKKFLVTGPAETAPTLREDRIAAK